MNDTQKLPKSDLCFYCSRPVDLANRGTVALGDKMAHLQCALEPRDTQNQWVPVSERLPNVMSQKLICGVTTGLAYLGRDSMWRDPYANCEVRNVTHWMDLPEPPEPPKPADPFEAWLAQQKAYNATSIYDHKFRVISKDTAEWVWNAAKEHYAKPLPDFEMWAKAHCADGPYLEVEKGGRLINERAARIVWNAAQGKPEV